MAITPEVVAGQFKFSESNEFMKTSGFQVGNPAQSLKTGHEAIFAASCNDELWQTAQAPTNRLLWNGEDVGSVVWPTDRILLGGRIDEEALVNPLGLNELELPLQLGSDEHKHESPI